MATWHVSSSSYNPGQRRARNFNLRVHRRGSKQQAVCKQTTDAILQKLLSCSKLHSAAREHHRPLFLQSRILRSRPLLVFFARSCSCLFVIQVTSVLSYEEEDTCQVATNRLSLYVYASVLSYEEEDTCQVATNRLSLYVYASVLCKLIFYQMVDVARVCVLCELASVCSCVHARVCMLM